MVHVSGIWRDAAVAASVETGHSSVSMDFAGGLDKKKKATVRKRTTDDDAVKSDVLRQLP